MANLLKLKNDPENRNIRDVVMSGGETIRVFEPSADDVAKIIEMQEKWMEGDELVINGSDIVRVLFKLLTDIEGLDELTDEEIQDVAENPSLAFIQVQDHVETIVSEVFKTVVLSARKRLLETDLEVEAYKVNEETFSRALSLAARETGTTNLLNKIEQAADGIIEAGEKQKEENITALNEYKNSVQNRVDHYSKMVEERRKEFAEADEKDLIK